MSKIYDVTINRLGSKITEKRAMKNEKYRHRQEKRREGNRGAITMLDDHFTMDMWEWEDNFYNSCRPLWFKAARQIHWWFEKNGFRATKRKIKYFWQRGRRGYSDFDLWSFDHYMAKVIRDGITEMNKIKHGWPGEPMTFEEWGEILTEISDGMQAHLDMCDVLKTKPPEHAALIAKRDLAFDHLKEHFGSLWD